jgi:hypothetical protein
VAILKIELKELKAFGNVAQWMKFEKDDPILQQKIFGKVLRNQHKFPMKWDNG